MPNDGSEIEQPEIRVGLAKTEIEILFAIQRILEHGAAPKKQTLALRPKKKVVWLSLRNTCDAASLGILVQASPVFGSVRGSVNSSLFERDQKAPSGA